MKKLLFSVFATMTVTVLSAANESTAKAYEPVGDHIKTIWAREVSPRNALTEYPRPQMVRKSWISLNGLWQYAITSSDVNEMPEPQGDILVPYCVESALSGVGKTLEPDQALWYGTTLQAPVKWKGRSIMLNFGAVDYCCEVYLDGELVLTHKGGYTSFSIDVTEYLADGSADLVLKVTDPTDDDTASVPHGKQKRDPHGIWYTPVTGIWQTVWMESLCNEAHIADYNVVPDIENGTFCVETVCEGTREGDKVRVEVLNPRIGYDTQHPGWSLFRKGKAKVACGQDAVIKIRRPRMWTPDDPWLYGLRITLLRKGKVLDRVEGYTAMRKVTAKLAADGAERLALNGEVLFQFGPLDQGWWPDGLYTAPTDEALRFDVVATRDLGFNMIRKHIKVEPSRWYYHCDREGIMVWQDMPCIGNYKDREDWGQGKDVYGAGKDYYALTDQCRDNYYREWGEIIAQLRKFPCIVMWVPFNEAWGQFDTKEVVDFTRACDPSRLVNAASGGNWIEGAGDILDSHHYPNPRMRLLDSTMVNVLGEYGGIGYPMEGHLWQEKSWGYVEFHSTDEVTDRYVEYIDSLKELVTDRSCAAAVYTQTTDVEGEVNGFYTYDRACLKMDGARVREANTSVIDIK